MNIMITASADELAAAFTEWDRRYREEPERFMSEATHLLKETPETYGQACAPYFIKLLGGSKKAVRLCDKTGQPCTGPRVRIPYSSEYVNCECLADAR